MSVLLGLDIGTTKISGVAVATSGRPTLSVERPNDAAVVAAEANRSEQDAGRIRSRCIDVLREMAASAGDVVAIGVTGQMHGMLCVDAINRPLGHLITWQDARCLEATGADGATSLDEMHSRVPPELWEVCGCTPASGYMGSTLFWLSRHGQLPPKTARVCFITDWVAASLADRMPVTDPGNACGAGLFDLVASRWHPEIVQALGLPANLLPEVRPSAEMIGHLTASAAREIGLPEGIPIANAIGDSQAAFLGSVANPDRLILVNVGTGGQISWVLPAFGRLPGMETRSLPPGRFVVMGASLCGGRAVAWLKDVVREWSQHFGGEQDAATIYARLHELALQAPADCGGLHIRPTLSGTRADPACRGSVAGISLENFTLGNLARALLIGVTDELRDFHERAAAASTAGHESIVASGNAVRKNPLLRSIIAERFARPVLVPRHREEAACGAAFLAGVAAGVWKDMTEASARIEYE